MGLGLGLGQIVNRVPVTRRKRQRPGKMPARPAEILSRRLCDTSVVVKRG